MLDNAKTLGSTEIRIKQTQLLAGFVLKILINCIYLIVAYHACLTGLESTYKELKL